MLYIFKTEVYYEDVADGVEKWFETSNYDENDKRHFQWVKIRK